MREVGGYGPYIQPLVAEGTYVGPRVYHAGSTVLTISGGHIDGDHAKLMPDHCIDVLSGYCMGPLNAGTTRLNTIAHAPTGPYECIAVTRENFRQGAQVFFFIII